MISPVLLPNVQQGLLLAPSTSTCANLTLGSVREKWEKVSGMEDGILVLLQISMVQGLTELGHCDVSGSIGYCRHGGLQGKPEEGQPIQGALKSCL